AMLTELYGELMRNPAIARSIELKEAVVNSIASRPSPQSQAALRRIVDMDGGRRDAVVQLLAKSPTAKDWPYFLKGLASSHSLVALEAIRALRRISVKPRAEDPVPYRTALGAAARLDDSDRWKIVELLRHWTNAKQFGAESKDWKTELTAWGKWYAQAFPKEPALPNVVAERPQESKYKFEEL